MEQHAQQHERTIGEYVAILRRRKWVVLQAAILVPIVAYALSSSKPKLFEASADVLLTSSVTSVASPLSNDTASIIQTQTQLAISPGIAERVLRRAKVKTRSEGQLLSEVGINQVGSSDVLRFSITDPDPVIATRLAGAYAHAYTDYRRALDSAFIEKARKELEARIAALRAAGDTQSQVYLSLSAKDQQLVTIQALETASAFVIREAGGAGQVQPRPARSTMLGLIGGVLLGVMLALLWEALDTRVRTAHEVASQLGLPLLGRVMAPPRRIAERQLVSLIDPTGPAAEAFRLLRSNLDFVNLDRGARVIMITSALQSEGKSTTAANLAATIARSGRRCALVDLDLRRPSIWQMFQLDNSSGLTTVALGRNTLDEVIFHVPVADLGRSSVPLLGGNGNGNGNGDGARFLDVLPSGPVPPEPGEFVTTSAVRSIIDELRDLVDVVIIDTPPLLGVGDAAALSPSVDGIVVVVRLGATKRPVLREMHRILDQMPTAKLGFVLTGAEHDEGYNYERDSYYHSQETTESAKAYRSARS
jgi:succinoglycan biosynthesis transport protein ExoP